MAGVLFEDIFDVKHVDPDGKKFDRGEYSLFLINNCFVLSKCINFKLFINF